MPRGVAQKQAIKESFGIAEQKRKFRNAKPLTEQQIAAMVANFLITKGVTKMNPGTAAGTRVEATHLRVMG